MLFLKKWIFFLGALSLWSINFYSQSYASDLIANYRDALGTDFSESNLLSLKISVIVEPNFERNLDWGDTLRLQDSSKLNEKDTWALIDYKSRSSSWMGMPFIPDPYRGYYHNAKDLEEGFSSSVVLYDHISSAQYESPLYTFNHQKKIVPKDPEKPIFGKYLKVFAKGVTQDYEGKNDIVYPWQEIYVGHLKADQPIHTLYFDFFWESYRYLELSDNLPFQHALHFRWWNAPLLQEAEQSFSWSLPWFQNPRYRAKQVGMYEIEFPSSLYASPQVIQFENGVPLTLTNFNGSSPPVQIVYSSTR